MKLVLVVLTALAVAVPASASSSETWWSADHAEGVLMDSDWSFDHDVQDATCSGWGSFKITTDGTKTYRRFVCTAYAEVTQTWCLPGECSNGTVTATCRYAVKFRTTGADAFLLAGVRSNCG